MKTKIFIALSIGIFLAAVFVIGGCSTGDDSETAAGYSYTVTFDKNIDSPDEYSTEANPQTKIVASPATTVGTLPKPPTRQGYEFLRWYTASGTFYANTVVSGDITVYADWDELYSGTYSVNFDKNGGDTEADPPQIIVWSPAESISENPSTERTTLPKPPSKAGALFDGWNTQDDGSGDEFDVDTTVDDHIIVYAKWDPIPAGQVAVIFWDKEGENQLKTILVDEGEKVDTADFPDKDTTIPYFQILSWRTADGRNFTTNTTVNATASGTLDVYINRIKLVGGPPRVVGDTLVHEYFLIEQKPVNPAFVGTISDEDGTIDFSAGAVRYKWPTVTDTGESITITDYAYCLVRFELIDYTRADPPNTGAGSGVILKQYDNDNDYVGITGNDRYPWLSSNSSIRFPISSGTTGGLSIRYGGVSPGGHIVFRITSVTFYKLNEHTVTFELDGGNGSAPAPKQVYHGESLGTQFPAAPTKTGFVFTGWKDQDDNTVTASTPINKDLTLTAQWMDENEATPVELDAPANGTLFSAGNDYAGAATYTYNGNSYWIVADARTYSGWADKSPVAPIDATLATTLENLQKSYGTIGGYTRIGLNFTTITDNWGDKTWSDYTKVTITYDLVPICGDTDIIVRDDPAGTNAGSTVQSGTIVSAGTGKTLTYNTSQFDAGRHGVGIVKNNATGAFLLRITKVTLHY